MSLHLYDTWTRSVREFTPLKAGEVGLYTCGPTVYDYQHIGNYRTFLFEDGLKRVLRLNGYRVNHVMNITDVGHLVSDADDGEDKMEKGSRRTGKSAWDIAALYTESFIGDLKALGIEFPSTLCKATDNIPEQISFIQEIERKGYTYRTGDGIYFDTSKQASYGYLGRLDIAGLQAGARVDLGEKKHPTDYALWKFSAPEDQRQMEWDSPWGRGFPGWHIECSAMAHKYLGAYFDIHCGGEDHITVHHPNEISQTEAAYGTRLANFWMHGYFLITNDAKMSKSSGEFLRLQLLKEKGIADPIAYRYLCLTAHYRSQLNFSWDALRAADTALHRLRRRFRIYANSHSIVESDRHDAEFGERFTNCLNDDLNFPQALAVMYELLKSEHVDGGVKLRTLRWFDEVLGLDLDKQVVASAVPSDVNDLFNARGLAKAERNWAEADRLREELKKRKWEVKDNANGSSSLSRIGDLAS